MNRRTKMVLGGLVVVGTVGLIAAAASAKGEQQEPEPDELPPPEPDQPEPDETEPPDDDGEPVEDQLPPGAETPEQAEAQPPQPRDRIVVDEITDRSPGLPELTPVGPPEPPTFTIEPLPGVEVTVPPDAVPPVPTPPAPPELVTKPPDIAPGEVAPAPTQPPLQPETEALLRELLGKETSPAWKAEEPLAGAWQRARGLTPDNKFGPGSAIKLAEETGLLPIVRFWPRGTLPGKAVPEFRAKLASMAARAEEPRKTHLLAAIEREQGQGFGTPPKPISPTIAI